MDVLMPQLGETVAEGKILRWFKAVGETVAAGENLCEIETDKVTVEVPAISGGVLTAINTEPGAVAPVGAVIAVLDGPAGGAALVGKPVTPPKASVRASPSSTATVPPYSANAASRKTLDPFREIDTPIRNFGPAKLKSGIVVTPLARRLAAEASLDLDRIAGSGPRGRITARDVETSAAFNTRTAAQPAGAEPIAETYLKRPHRLAPVDGMRRTIARRLSIATATVPHFYLAGDIDSDRIVRLRVELNESLVDAAGKSGGDARKFSLNDFMIKAWALALREVPHANAVWSDNGILEFEQADIAVAVAVPGGVLTPVILSADTKPLSVLSSEAKDLAKRAREGTLLPQDCQGRATTISNLGMHGVEEFSAIINPPQSTILALGTVSRRAVETAGGGIAFAGRIKATISADHRVVDGVVAAELFGAFKALLENPLRLLV